VVRIWRGIVTLARGGSPLPADFPGVAILILLVGLLCSVLVGNRW